MFSAAFDFQRPARLCTSFGQQHAAVSGRAEPPLLSRPGCQNRTCGLGPDATIAPRQRPRRFVERERIRRVVGEGDAAGAVRVESAGEVGASIVPHPADRRAIFSDCERHRPVLVVTSQRRDWC